MIMWRDTRESKNGHKGDEQQHDKFITGKKDAVWGRGCGEHELISLFLFIPMRKRGELLYR